MYRGAFPGLLDDMEDPTLGTMTREAIVAIPSRAVREGVRSLAKQAVGRVAGERGLDFIKSRWTAVRLRGS
jgi:hypothetical protein